MAISRVDEYVYEMKLSHTPDGNVKWPNHFKNCIKKQFESFLEIYIFTMHMTQAFHLFTQKK